MPLHWPVLPGVGNSAFTEYRVPPSGRTYHVVPVFAIGAAAIVMLSVVDAVWTGVPLSVTATTKVEVPALVGVPAIAPVPDRLRPVGRTPDVSDHVSAVLTPVACN